MYTMKNFQNDPCALKLTDQEYLHHMIPHHQVAVDISKLLQKKNKKSINARYIKKINLDTKL